MITGHECRRSLYDRHGEWHRVLSVNELRDLRRATAARSRSELTAATLSTGSNYRIGTCATVKSADRASATTTEHAESYNQAAMWKEAADVAAHGFAIRRGLAESDLLDIASAFGTPVAEPRDGIIVKPLRPVAISDAPSNTLSARYGAGAFPLHTEAAYWREPPRFLLLYCVVPGAGEQDTLVVDTETIAREPNAAALSTEPWIVAAGMSPFLTTVVSSVGSDRPLFRFDGECMRPATAGGIGRVVLWEFLNSAIPNAHKWRAGDLLILDNWRMLHGRGAAAAGAAADRLLLKVMVRQ